MRTISFLAADGTVNQSTFNNDGTPTWEEDYTFDPTGNWGNYLTKVAGSTTLNQNRTHNKDNALLPVAGSSALVAVNSVGNLTTAPVPGNWAAGCYQVYDAWNRLVSVSEDSWDSVDSEEEFGVVGTYAYDGLSRRVTKVSGSVSVTRHYYYTAQWQIAEERVGSATTEDRQLVWGLRGLDDLVLRDVGTVRLYAMHDYFNCTAVTNPGGVVTERYGYDGFGQALFMSSTFGSRSSSTFGWETLFCNYRWDVESGFYQARYRYQHPGLGRWLNRDPIAEWGGLNLYAYVRNNPINLFDPLGLVDCGALAAAIANQENLIDGAIRSMSDINQMFNSTMATQDAAFAIEALEAGLGGDAMNAELKSYRAAPWTYQEGLKTAVIVGTAATAVDETKNRVVGAGIEKLTGLDIFDPANTMAESQEKMSENASASTYQTIRGLQGQLANMMDMYQQNCPCKK